MPALVSKLRSSRHKTMFTQEVRLSPATLQIFTEAHKVLSDETHRLGIAAAEVFRRCELLQQELVMQIQKVGEVKAIVDRVSGGGGGGSDDGGDGQSDEARFVRRLARADERQDALMARLDKMRELVGRGPPRPLSDKERAYAEELRNLESNVLGGKGEDGGGEAKGVVALSSPSSAGSLSFKSSTTARAAAAASRQEAAKLWRRMREVRRLQAEMAAEAQEIIEKQQQQQQQQHPHHRTAREDDAKKQPAEVKQEDGVVVVGRGGESGAASPAGARSLSSSAAGTPGSASALDLRIPNEVRRAKMAQVMALLDRETALVEAVSARLERLQVGGQGL
jgi:nucleoporin NUP82